MALRGRPAALRVPSRLDVSAFWAWVETHGILHGVGFVLGALVGSFLNVVIVRLPRGENLAWPGSHCPKCKTPIHPLHNVPLLSWVVLRGRCAHCATGISPRYPLVELVTATLFMAAASRFGATWALPASWAFLAALVAATFIDLEHWIIPDEIVLYGLPFALVLRPLVFAVPWWDGCVAAALGAAFILLIRWSFFALRGIEGMGLGDATLIAFIGAFLGISALLPVLTIASLSGAVIGGLLLLLSPSPPPQDGEPEGPDAGADADEPWARAPQKLRLGFVLRTSRRRIRVGVPEAMSGRTHLRFGLLMGLRWTAGFEVLAGCFQDVPGWGHFEGIAVGRPVRVWFGPIAGARLADVEAFGDDEEWIPPPTGLPFGPFLALGAIATMLFAPWIQLGFRRLAATLGLIA